MKLITKPIERALAKAPLYSNDGKGADAKVIVKFFGGGRYTYFVTEAEKKDDGDYLFFGYCISPLGPDCDEWGYVTFSELKAIKFPPFGLPIERDRYLDPNKSTVAELVPALAS